MFSLIFSYFIWHYTRSFKDTFNLFVNFGWFIYHFFSIKIFFKTLFSPWKKTKKKYKQDPFVSFFFEKIFTNFFMRCIGFFLRGLMIVIGLGVLGTIVIAGLFTVICWTLLPFIIVLLFISGLRLLV